MGCCGSKPNKCAPLIVDVQQVIADRVWSSFLDSRTWWQRKLLKRKDYEIDVPMNYYDFEETDQKLDMKKSTGTGGSRHGKKGGNLLAGKELAHRDQTSPEIIGLETEFRNNTDEAQTYNFRFEKTRTATLKVSYQKGFSIGSKTNFTIKLPGGDIGTELDVQKQVTETTEQNFDETLTTSVTSEITVSPRSEYTASVVMEERNIRADFKVWVTMSMPAKAARAFIKNKNGKTVFYYGLSNLSHLFPSNKIEITPTAEGQPKRFRADAVQFVVEGVVHGMQLSSHKINLDSHKLSTRASQKPSEATLVYHVTDAVDASERQTGLGAIASVTSHP